MISVGTAEAGPGEIATGHLQVGQMRDGTPIRLPVGIVNGVADGKTLYVQSVSDGDELNGLGVVRELFQGAKAKSLSGTIIFVGIVNVLGFQVGEHRNPIDNRKMNRTYPGNREGTSSERIARATFDVVKRADLAVDLHQASTDRMVHEVRVRCGRRHRMHADCLELASVFDTGNIVDIKGPRGQLARVAANDGIPVINPELGGAVGWDDRSIEIGLRGMYNVLDSYGFSDGDVDRSPQTKVTNFSHYSAQRGGLVRFEKSLGDRVDTGDPLFTIVTPFGEERDTVAAEQSGYFWRTARLPRAASGEYVCSVGTDATMYHPSV